MNTKAKTHLSLYVKDIQKTKAFYQTFFGMEATKEKEGYLKFNIESPALVISFLEDPLKAQRLPGHLGFQVDSMEELKVWHDTVRAKGYQTLEEMQTNCCYALQDKFWINDPDENAWEVYVFHQDSEFNDPKYASASEEACCVAPQQNEKESACC